MAELIAGCDEVGRGPLAGPVTAAAVILPRGASFVRVRDSKLLGAAQREQLAEEIRSRAICWAIAFVGVETIDRLNIFQASLLAMRRALENLSCIPDRVLIDGRHTPELDLPMRAIVGGDAKRKCIGAASILAKSARDTYMREIAELYPGYGFERHVGYATLAHRDALARLGPTPEHRRSFRACQGWQR